MKRAYIAHPLSGDWTANILSAKRFCIAAMMRGVMPVAPYIVVDGILDDDDPAQRAEGMILDTQQLMACDELWVCGDRVSAGMAHEIATAQAVGIPVVPFEDGVA